MACCSFKGLCFWHLLWGEDLRWWSSPTSILIISGIEWVSHCSPVTRQEAQFALSNCHPLGINMNQAKKSLPAQRKPYFYGLVNACRELYIHLFNSKLGKHFLVSSNWLKMIIFKVVSCYESEACFQKMSAVLVYQWCQISMYFIVYFTPWLRHVGKKNTSMYTICLLTSQQ